jgi:hypothetical protein
MPTPKQSQVEILRNQITDEQRALLSAVWSYFRRHKQWVPVRVLHRNHGGKLRVHQALEELGGSIVVEEPDRSGRDLYQLTLLGVLLTEHGEQYEQLLAQYIEYMAQGDPHSTEIRSQDVAQVLKLDAENLILLGDLINLGRLFGSPGASNLGTEQWVAGVLDEVDDLPPDKRLYVHSRATKSYEPKMPLPLIERQRYSTQKMARALSSVQPPSYWESLVRAVDKASSADEKGKALEELMCRLFATIPGFSVSKREKTATEEIDIVIMNNSELWPFKKEKAILIVECKNWSDKCGKDEFVLFQEKVENRNKRCSLGFFVSWNGFRQTFEKEQLRGSRDDVLIVTLSGDDIRAAVATGDFYDVLFQGWYKAVLL